LENYKKFIIEFKNLSLSSILFILLPIALIASSFISHLVVAILSLIGFYIYFKIERKNNLKNYFIYLFLFFSFYLIFSSLISGNIYLSFEASLFYIRFIFFSFFVFYLINLNTNIPKYFVLVLIIVFLILSADGFFQFIFNYNIIGLELIAGRVSSFFGEELILGSFISRLFPLLFGSLFIYFLDKKNLFKIIFFIICFNIVILSGERTALFNFIFFILVFLIFGKFNNFNLFKLVIFSLISALIIFIFEIFLLERNIDETSHYRFLNETKEQIFSNSIDYKKLNFYSESHENMAITAINIWYNHKIFGSGPKTFRIECKNIDNFLIDQQGICSSHPHNILLQILSETGLIGVIFFVLFLYVIFKDLFILIKEKISIESSLYNFKLSILITFLINLFPFIPGPNFFGSYINIIFYIPMGFYIYYFRKIKYEKIF